MAVEGPKKPYSYIDSIEFSDWDGQQSLIVFDGVCVLCSSFVGWVLQHDKGEKFLFTMAQSDLGQVLYDHFDLDRSEFETNLVIINGRVYEKLDAMIAVLEAIGWPWRLAVFLRPFPLFFKNWIYDRIAKNRYVLFGKRDHCMMPNANLARRMIGESDERGLN